MATITFASLRDRVNPALNEFASDPASVYRLALATGGTDELNADAGLARLMNDEKDFLFRRVLTMEASFAASFAGGQFSERYDVFTATSDGTSGATNLTGAKLWWPRLATTGTTPLQFIGEQYLRAYDATYQQTPVTVAPAAAPVPAKWYRGGERYLGVYPVPSQITAITAFGFCVPADTAADGSGGFDNIDAAMVQMLVDGTCIRAMAKNTQSGQLTERMGPIRDRYDRALLSAWMEIPAFHRNKEDGAFKTPPVVMGGK